MGRGELNTSSREELLDDAHWKEVLHINSYAVFMGYLSMAIKGLGFLILTWTTVVLLGGFVSMLRKKDFWSLTFITLVQTAGVFDSVMNEKLSYIEISLLGLFEGVFSGVAGKTDGSTMTNNPRFWLAVILSLAQGLSFIALLFPLALVYVFGISISGGISLWRLIEHDYVGKSDSDAQGANLAPAMDTLYYLALLQGVLFCYRFILNQNKKGLAKRVASTELNYWALEVISNYLHETVRGCEQNPSFAKGRNLITYAVDMIGHNSPVDCISGVKILYTTIRMAENRMNEKYRPGLISNDYRRRREILRGHYMVMKHFVVSATSSRHILQKLLETLDSTGLHDRETRRQAAMIVECLASNINLEQFPRGIQHISSLIDTVEEYIAGEPFERYYMYDQYQEDWKMKVDSRPSQPEKPYKELLLRGLCILRKLAADENNCRIMSDTRDLVSKIMAPVTDDLLDHTTDDHGTWSDVVERSMDVMGKLTGAPGETGAKLRREISSCEEAISTLERILSCDKCDEKRQLSAIQILTRLYIDTESRSEASVGMLLDIFSHGDKYSSSVRECAGEALSEICFRSSPTISIQTSGYVVDGLTQILVHEKSKVCRKAAAEILTQTSGYVVDGLTQILVHDKSKVCRKAAAEILNHLCTHYTKDDEYLGKLKKSVLEVFGDTLVCRKVLADIKNKADDDDWGPGVISMVESVSSAIFLSSLLSLSWTVYDMFKSELDPDLDPGLDSSSFVGKLSEMALGSEYYPSANKLLLYKTIGEVVILMMRRSNGKFVKQKELTSLMKALSAASKRMLDIDYSMVFSPAHSSSAATPRSKRTLESLVKEAQELYAKMPLSTSSTSASG